jgi:hypothetical protein
VNRKVKYRFLHLLKKITIPLSSTHCFEHLVRHLLASINMLGEALQNFFLPSPSLKHLAGHLDKVGLDAERS